MDFPFAASSGASCLLIAYSFRFIVLTIRVAVSRHGKDSNITATSATAPEVSDGGDVTCLTGEKRDVHDKIPYCMQKGVCF